MVDGDTDEDKADADNRRKKDWRREMLAKCRKVIIVIITKPGIIMILVNIFLYRSEYT